MFTILLTEARKRFSSLLKYSDLSKPWTPLFKLVAEDIVWEEGLVCVRLFWSVKTLEQLGRLEQSLDTLKRFPLDEDSLARRAEIAATTGSLIKGYYISLVEL